MTVRADGMSRPAQRGAALLMAMVIVTVVATIASSMVWQQWRAVQVEAAERGREQLQWLLVGAVDFTSLILNDDANRRQTDGSIEPTSLDQNWSKELKETRISAFLAVDKDNTDDAPDAFLSGRVSDVNGRYNLRNLLDPSTATTAVKVDPSQVKVLANLFRSLDKVPPTLAQEIADALEKATLAAMNTTTSFAALGNSQAARNSAPLMPQKLDQLVWLVPSIDPPMLERMRPYIFLQPYDPGASASTKVNLNTASKEVIAAVWGIDVSAADGIVRYRQKHAFSNPQNAEKIVAGVPLPPDAFDVYSEYFEVTGMLRLENQVMKQRTLVRRMAGSRQSYVVIKSQESFSGIDPGN